MHCNSELAMVHWMTLPFLRRRQYFTFVSLTLHIELELNVAEMMFMILSKISRFIQTCLAMGNFCF